MKYVYAYFTIPFCSYISKIFKMNSCDCKFSRDPQLLKIEIIFLKHSHRMNILNTTARNLHLQNEGDLLISTLCFLPATLPLTLPQLHPQIKNICSITRHYKNCL